MAARQDRRAARRQALADARQGRDARRLVGAAARGDGVGAGERRRRFIADDADRRLAREQQSHAGASGAVARRASRGGRAGCGDAVGGAARVARVGVI